MNNCNEKAILTLEIPKELKEDLEALCNKYERTMSELLIPLLNDYVISKNAKLSCTQEEMDKILNDLDDIFRDIKTPEKPKEPTWKEIEQMMKDGSIWD